MYSLFPYYVRTYAVEIIYVSLRNKVLFSFFACFVFLSKSWTSYGMFSFLSPSLHISQLSFFSFCIIIYIFLLFFFYFASLTEKSIYSFGNRRICSTAQKCLYPLIRHNLHPPQKKNQTTGPGQIPTGELAPVAGTFFDFSSKAHPLGDAIDGIGGDPPGLDHCLVTVGASSDGKAEVNDS